MKKIYYCALIFSCVLYSCGTMVYTYTEQPVRRTPPPPNPIVTTQVITDQVFYDELDPYGQWIDFPDYGYVWKPNVQADFRPYSTNGQWAYTTEGWTWVSEYSWGWAPFHYGRWFFDDYYGWLWLPGHQWAPAWVTWGQSGNYYGWAPIPPRVDINTGWRPRDNDWCYVRAEHINQNHVNNYIIQNNYNVVNNTVIVNNYYNQNNRNPHPEYYNRGPNIIQVQNITNVKIQQVTINERVNPGQTTINNNQITVYRPSINSNNQQTINKPIPQHVGIYNRDNGNQQQSRWNNDGNRQNSGQLNNPNQVAQPAPIPGNNYNPVNQPQQNQRQWNNPNQVTQPAPISGNNNNPVNQPQQTVGQGGNSTQQPQRPGNVQWNIQKQQQVPQQAPVQPQNPVNNPTINIVPRPPVNNQPNTGPVKAFIKNPNPKPASAPPPKPVDNNKKPLDN